MEKKKMMRIQHPWRRTYTEMKLSQILFPKIT
jgi:hypothetical protein